MAVPARPHPLARGRFANRADRLLAHLWDKGLAPPPRLDAATIWAAGVKGFSNEDETGGRSEAEVADFRLRLDALLTALRGEAELNNLGRTIAYGLLVRIIRQRHGLGRLWRHKPALAATRLAPPIIVVGQMRAGTTRVHRLLAADPAHSATRFCDSWHPVPQRPDWRPAKGAVDLAVARLLDPWLDALHPMGARRAEEELGWLASALGGSTFYTQWRVPSFTALSETRDPAPIYAEFARILRTDAAHHRNAGQPRVLKVPEFAEALPALLQQFPDARLVVARRDHDEVARSAASLVANQMAIQSDRADLRWIEAEWRRKIALRHERVEAFLAGWHGPVAHVDFDRLGSDWEAEMGRVYAVLDLPFSAATTAAMRAEQARAAKGGHG